jgi:hypothetical protein
MSYRYCTTSTLGPKWTDVRPGSDEFNSNMTEIMAAYADCGVEVELGGWSSHLGVNVFISTAPDVASANRCQVILVSSGLVQDLQSGPFSSTEEVLANMPT